MPPRRHRSPRLWRPVRAGEALGLVARASPRRSLSLRLAWTAAVGARLAARVWPLGLDGHRLRLTADDPRWAGEIEHHRQAVFEALDGVLGAGTVRVLDLGPHGLVRRADAPSGGGDDTSAA